MKAEKAARTEGGAHQHQERRAAHVGKDLVELQRKAGNDAVTALLSAQGLVVQREVMEYVKDAYAHAKELVKKDEKKKDDDGEEWEKPSEEVALHTREAFDLASVALKKAASSVKDKDPTGAAETLEYAEGFDKASELVKTGGEVFEKGVKAVKLAQAALDLKEAVQEVNSHDILSDPQGSAKAFDHLFAATGVFANSIAPKGPWSGYFELLTHFKDNGGFFANVGAEMRLETGPEATALKEAGIDVSKENKFAPAKPEEEKVSLGKLYENVESKVNRLKATPNAPVDIDLGFDDFRARFNAFAEAYGFYDRLSFVSRLRKSDVYVSAVKDLIDATNSLIERLEGLERDATGTQITFQPDIQALQQLKEKLQS